MTSPGALVASGVTACRTADAVCWTGAVLFASDVSMDAGSRATPAMAASMIDKNTNSPPRTDVLRVRKSAAPRAVMNPDELPPTPSPPPSERCIRITATSAAATTV